VYTERLRLSPHFEALLKKSKNHGELYLPDSSAYLNTKNVKIYIHFLYTSTLATEVTGTENDLGFLRAECELLGELYRLGLVSEDPRFRNAVLDVILEISRLKGKDGVSHLPHPGTFSNLPHDSPARRCIVDLIHVTYLHLITLASSIIPVQSTHHVRKCLCDARPQQQSKGITHPRSSHQYHEG
jgi:hypothetical protein